MAMPAAKGLFHRAIAQSGAAVRAIPRDSATRTAETVMMRAGAKQPDDLKKMPMDQLLMAIRGGPPPGGLLPFGPVTDGRVLPHDPWDPIAPPESADIPLMTGTTATEVTFIPATPLDPMDDVTFQSRVKQTLRVDDQQAAKLIALYRKNQPNRENIDLFLRMATDASNFRAGVETLLERKVTAGKAPVYAYRFEWYSPVRQGKLRSFHTLEIPFIMDNVDGAISMTGSGPERYQLAHKMSDAWVAFAKTGNPNTRELPSWPQFNLTDRPTMVFNNECQMVNDPHGEERRALKEMGRNS
jgi:para-nitrobenzyl esterase